MEIKIFRPEITEQVDQEVPQYGGYSLRELRQPILRSPREPQFGEQAQEALWNSAVERIIYNPKSTLEPPFVHFPNAENIQHFPFTHNHWKKFGYMEAEYNRINYMLARHPERGFPVDFRALSYRVLCSDNTLQAWSEALPEVGDRATEIYFRTLDQMDDAKEGRPGAYEAEPVHYQYSGQMAETENHLWDRALDQAESEFADGNLDHLGTFLDLYNRVKDPITPITSRLDQQAEIFEQLLASIPGRINRFHLAQAALESAFLALPGAAQIDSVVYGHHHELPYLHVNLAQLPRGERANPHRVNEVTKELLDQSEKVGQAIVTPIMVAYGQEPASDPRLFILDGNNRATAILLMRYLDFVKFDKAEFYSSNNLQSFVDRYQLSSGWGGDLFASIQTLDRDGCEAMVSRPDLVSQFATHSTPALLVQEPNFHTIAVAKSKGKSVTTLQPWHQIGFNMAEYAIKSKMQSHGRTADNHFGMT